MRRYRFLILALVGVLAFAACSSDSDDNSNGDTTTTGETAAEGDVADSEMTVEVVDSSEFGEILATSEGFTLYAFTPDEAEGKPTCTDSCASTWPPFADSGNNAPEPWGDADFGSVDNPDGSVQVTYKGLPLYTYSGDSSPGETNGQGVGGQWFVVGQDGIVGG
ncbi:MAG: hypothetical protein R3A49_09665 [Acidimicrobiia bacterium]